jgi:hypothetical protein
VQEETFNPYFGDTAFHGRFVDSTKTVYCMLFLWNSVYVRYRRFLYTDASSVEKKSS